jgi:hypothetical protein
MCRERCTRKWLCQSNLGHNVPSKEEAPTIVICALAGYLQGCPLGVKLPIPSNVIHAKILAYWLNWSVNSKKNKHQEISWMVVQQVVGQVDQLKGDLCKIQGLPRRL